MTTSTIPPHENPHNLHETEVPTEAPTPPVRWNRHTPITSSEYSDMSMMFGALSILTFWMFGLGILLGAAALGAGLSARRPDTAGHNCGDGHGAIGILTGTAGIAFGIVFLTAAVPHL